MSDKRNLVLMITTQCKEGLECNVRQFDSKAKVHEILFCVTGSEGQTLHTLMICSTLNSMQLGTMAGVKQHRDLGAWSGVFLETYAEK